jgi:thiol-disulfide isomerase/thioredoxin
MNPAAMECPENKRQTVGRQLSVGMTAHLLGVLMLAIGTRTEAVASSLPLPVEGKMPALDRGTEWLNSKPLTPADLRGKVVLINFWTYTCINWLRSYPYVRAWAERYKEQGLVVIGVHTPEFSFEKDLANVRWAVKDRKLDYPVVADNDYAIWRAFENQSWPALYFVDARGRVRHHRFGEGSYEESEQVIRQLLAEAGSGGTSQEPLRVTAVGIEAAADWGSLRSPENYLGKARTENFSSRQTGGWGQPAVYAIPERLGLNHWAIAGAWSVRDDAVALNQPKGRIAYRFHARDLHLVMGPASRGATVRFRVLIDGQPPGAAHGADIDGGGDGTVREQRTYQLIRQEMPIVDRLIEIEFLDVGVEAFSFTFG